MVLTGFPIGHISLCLNYAEEQVLTFRGPEMKWKHKHDTLQPWGTSRRKTGVGERPLRPPGAWWEFA